MASSSPICGICDSRHIYKPSEVWCSECDQKLCVDCTQHHSLSNGTRNHNTMPMSDYQKLPSFVLNISKFCQKHNEKFRFYCRRDECPCCEICMVENHKDCKDVAILKDIAKIVKKSVQFKEVEQLIDELMITVDTIRKNREKNLVDVSEQKRIVENEIRELRTEINNHLDKLQEDLMKELTNEETKITEKTRELLFFLDEKEKDLTEYQTNVVNIKQYASDLQTCLAMQQIESGIDTHDTSLHALVNSDTLNQTKLSCKIDMSLRNIITSIEKFGEVVVESKPCDVSFVRRKDKQAQTMVADLQPIDDIQLNLKQKINVGRQEKRGWLSAVWNWRQTEKIFTGCSLLPDGRMVFSCCNHNTVWFTDKDGVELFQIGKDKIGHMAYDTVYIKDNNSIAVSSGHGSNECISIIDIESQEVKTTISMKTNVYHMAVRGITIYCCTKAGLKMINLSDKSVSDIINTDMDFFSCVATYGDKLYYTNRRTKTVTCCDLQGKTQWEFNDISVMVFPCGITVDNDGNLYVGCFDICVISPDGQRHKLLSNKDGLENPTLLDYDKSTNRLLTVNLEGTAILFDVTRGQ